jgi:hypothetical protein
MAMAMHTNHQTYLLEQLRLLATALEECDCKMIGIQQGISVNLIQGQLDAKQICLP